MDGPRFTRLLPVTLPGLVFLVVAAEVTRWQPALLLEAAGLLAVSLLCLPLTRGFSRWFALAAGVGSAALVAGFHMPLPAVAAAALSGGPMLSLLLLSEVLATAIQNGGYDRTVTGILIRSARTAGAVRRSAGVAAFLLALSGMFVAAVPAVYYLFSGRHDERGLPVALSATRGFALAAMLSPIAPLVVLALAASGASVSQYLLYALPVGILLFALDWLPQPGDRRPAAPQAAAGTAAGMAAGAQAEGRWGGTRTVALLGAVLVFALVYRWLAVRDVTALVRISTSVAAAALVLGQVAPGFRVALLREVPAHRFAAHASSVPLFALGGMLGSLLVESGILAPVIALMRQAQLAWLEVPLIILLIVAFRWLGVAPVITLLVVGPVLAPAVSIPPPLYALALSFGGVAGFLASPFSATNLMVAAATGLSPIDVSVHRQGRYALALGIAVSGYAVLLLR